MTDRAQTRRTPLFLSYRSIIVTAVAISATLAGADEDWRKLIDRQPPYLGPAVTGQIFRPDADGLLRGDFPAQNIALLSWLPLTSFPNAAAQTTAADCWGYVSPSGREYAILGLRAGTAFIEVTDPVNPVIVGYVSGPTSLWKDNTVIGHHAYLVSEGGRGIQVVDMSQIDSGVVTHVQDRMQAGHTSTHTIVSNPDSGFLYLCGTNINNGGLTAVSTADPANPTIVGAWTVRYVHEAQIVTYTEGPYAGREIAFCFTGGPGTSITTTGGFDIVDVTDKSNMFTLAEVRYPGLRFCHQGWLSEDRRYMYVNDELDEGVTVATTTTHIFDVSDLTSPFYAGAFTNGSTAVDHNLYVRGNLIFAGNYRSGLRIYDATNPTNLHEVAYIDTWPQDDNPQFNGVWGNYPYFPSGTVIISDMEKGLLVVRPEINFITMEFPIGTAQAATPRRPTEVFVRVNALGAPLDPATVRVVARIGGGEFQDRRMIHVGDGVFRGTLPPAECFSTISYYITASNTEGTAFRWPATAPSSLLTADVVTGEDVLFEDDMEINRGWTVNDPQNPDTATAGIWNRMAPQATTAQPGEDHTPPPGTICWVTDGRAGSSPGQYDVDNGKTTLMSPSLNLAAHPEARIGYWRWYSNSAGAGPNTDTFDVAITGNGGQDWVTVEQVGPGGPQTAGGWFYHEFRVADLLPPTSTVRLRFVASDYDPQSLVEAAVDDFVVRVPVCDAGCLADRDGNGVVNSSDISRFIAEWLADVTGGTFHADFDGLSGTNSADISAFISAWLHEVQNGC